MLVPFVFIALWEGLARGFSWQDYFIPAPSRIALQIYNDAAMLASDFMTTGLVTLLALFGAFILAFVLAVSTHFSRVLSAVLTPFTLILQITPIIALAPLLLIYATPARATLIIAILIAFYPLYASFLSGFKAVNAQEEALFTLYKATKRQKFLWLELPSSLPFVRAGLEVASGLALVGTVVGEFTAGLGSGLAVRLLESQYRLNIPRLYACLVLIIALGFMVRLIFKLIYRQQKI